MAYGAPQREIVAQIARHGLCTNYEGCLCVVALLPVYAFRGLTGSFAGNSKHLPWPLADITTLINLKDLLNSRISVSGTPCKYLQIRK